MLNVVSYSGGPKGIDVPIRKFQEKLHGLLLTAWGIETALYQSYARCYRNKKGTGYVAEVYTGSNEYKEVYWNDSFNAISFFGIGNTISHEKIETVDVHLVFFVNLEKLKPALTNRGDEEVRLDVLNAVQTNNFGFRYTGVELGIENVLKEYPGSYRDGRLNAVDMHPVHCFRLNFSLTYNKNICF